MVFCCDFGLTLSLLRYRFAIGQEHVSGFSPVLYWGSFKGGFPFLMQEDLTGLLYIVSVFLFCFCICCRGCYTLILVVISIFNCIESD